MNFSSNIHRQIEFSTKERVSRLQEHMLYILKTYEDFVRYSATGVKILLETYEGSVPHDVMQKFFIEMMKIVPDVFLLYYSNNSGWNQPDGYLVFNDGWSPDDPAYDQTVSPWFIATKAKNGEIAYSEPYFDISYGKFVIMLSMTLFDEVGQDMGVICEEITVESLEDMLKTRSGQAKMYVLDKNGICIIDADGAMPLETNFFQKTNLDSYRAAIFTQAAFAGRNSTYVIYSAYIPGADYYLVSLLPIALISAEVNSYLFIILGVSIGILLLSSLVTFLITRNIVPSFTSQEQGAIALVNDIDNVAETLSDREKNNRNQEILKTIDALIISGQVKQSSGDMPSETQRIMDHKEPFESITAELADNINKIAASIENISDVAIRAEEISDENRQHIDMLIKEIFRLRIRNTWLPNGRKNQLIMAKNWSMVLKTNAATWNIPYAEVMDLVTLTAEADSILTEAQNSRRTAAMTEKCKAAFDALTEKMCSIKNHYLFNLPLSDGDFSTLNLTPNDTNHSPTSPFKP
ncbi:MAG: cache domain-containing protein [Treponema sp.]|nr:cache domain-containing protein [Treponema sp.]